MELAVRVPQILNLLYRRLAVGRAIEDCGRAAGCKPAIRQITNPRYIFWSDAMPQAAPQRMKMESVRQFGSPSPRPSFQGEGESHPAQPRSASIRVSSVFHLWRNRIFQPVTLHHD
jgi:hypothetical protein